MGKHKYLNQTNNQHKHIGGMITAQLKAQRLSAASMARALNVNAPVFAGYLKRSSVQAGILWNLGLAMNYNFFAELAYDFPADLSVNIKAPLQALLDEKDERIAALEKEIEIYKSVITGFKNTST